MTAGSSPPGSYSTTAGNPLADIVPGMGAPDAWARRTNTYPGCTCPPWRYNPRHPKPTTPDCPQHGGVPAR
ncbi:hypothetical protein ACIPY0_13400 [Paenarthrobacter nicotinovorans]|uniref:hypothetical protein n=1 Tax=Paenarthrobacter nicotinovorans TaxID=29320 RepID=UPI0038090AAC